jgi:hypothetical protein
MRPDVPRSNIPGLVTQSGLAPPKLRASSKLSLFALLSSFLHHRQQTKHYLTAASIFNDEPVFALRVEETRPMAGRPIWKTHSEYPDRLGISRGHIHTQIIATYCRMVLGGIEPRLHFLSCDISTISARRGRQHFAVLHVLRSFQPAGCNGLHVRRIHVARNSHVTTRGVACQ